MKKTFLKYEKPFLTVMLQCKTPEVAIDRIHKSLAIGGEAFGLQTECLLPEYRNPETYKRIFAEMQDKPVYVTNYRRPEDATPDDEMLAEGLLTLADCGATLCDVMGDMFCRHPEEMTDNPAAIEKQMRLIDELHQRGAEVLMSSHVMKYTPAERVLEIALEQQRRGVDVVKIVTSAGNMEEQLENLRIANLLKQNLKVSFLYLSGGECKILRRIGGNLGCCMYLCQYEHDEYSTAAQPLLTKVKAIRDNMEWWVGSIAAEKSNWKVGDKVCALLGGGGYAQFANVKYDMLMPVPAGCSMIEAAAIPEAFATAYLNLFIEGGIKAGDTLFMNAGASGLASVIIPMAKAFGIRVITTVLTEEIAAHITHLNADRVVVTAKENIAEVLKEELEQGHPVDVAIDCLGGEVTFLGRHAARENRKFPGSSVSNNNGAGIRKFFFDPVKESPSTEDGFRTNLLGSEQLGHFSKELIGRMSFLLCFFSI